MTDDEDSAAESTRERAQSLRGRLADAVDAPAQQDEQAARRRREELADGDPAGETETDPTDREHDLES